MAEQDDFAELIPELPLWNNGSGIGLEEWIGCVGSFEHAIGYGAIFWPDFVEHDGCILRRRGGRYRASYERWLTHTGGKKRAVEQMINHQHVLDLFPNVNAATRAQVLYLGRLLREVWQAKLSRQFPGRAISVFFDEGPFDDLIDYQLTAYQTAEAAPAL